MPDTLNIKLQWTDKLHFWGKAPYEQTVAIDHSPPLGDGNGIRPTELLLMSLAGCSGQTIISLLQKMKQDVRSFAVAAEGIRRDDHPRIFTEIRLKFELGGPGLNSEAVEKSIRMSEDKYCPVWAMLKPGVRIVSSYQILA
jgi:putative redox protein